MILNQPSELPYVARVKGQKFALLTNLFSSSVTYVVIGPLMMIYASDVLKFSTQQIAGILGLLPLLNIVFPFLASKVAKYKKVKILVLADLLKLIAVTFLFILPDKYINFSVYLLILLTYSFSWMFISSVLWQPLLRDITVESDRGRFFARMRFCFTFVTTIIAAVIPFLIGEHLEGWQYKLILLFCVFGIINRIFWERQIPELPKESNGRSRKPFSFKGWIALFKESKLLRTPLLVNILINLQGHALIIVYLKNVLEIPSKYITVLVFVYTFGQALSFLIWGRVADIIGYQLMTRGLAIISMLFSPLILFIQPNSVIDIFNFNDMNSVLMTIGILTITFLAGSIVGGTGIAAASNFHFHSRGKNVTEQMSIYNTIMVTLNSALGFTLGYLIHNSSNSLKINPLVDQYFHLDFFKLYILLSFGLGSFIIFILVKKMPNTREDYSMSDFFASISISSFRHMYAERLVYTPSTTKRASLARMLGNRSTPQGVESLIDLLDDPSYDVKVEAIRSLAYCDSKLAGKKLHELLSNPEKRHLADQSCWALGELKYIESYETLLEHCGIEYANRIRAMAARALAKLEDKRAIPHLAAMLTEEKESMHVRSSLSWALLKLDAVEYSGIIFNTIVLMRARDDRYELIEECCRWFQTNGSMVRRATENRSYCETMLEEIELKNSHWKWERRKLVQIIEDKKFLEIQDALQQLEEFTDGKYKELLTGLVAHLKELKDWTPLHTLAAQILIEKQGMNT